MHGVTASQGACVPGPCLPHASIHPSPDTTAGDNGGYQPNEKIVGFAQLHVQGTGGVTTYGNFLVSPQLGLSIVEGGHSSGKTNELALCDYYRVDLSRYDIRCEVTPAHHSALYRFTFPAATNATLAIDVGRKIGGVLAMNHGSVRMDPATGVIRGGGQFSKNWNPASYALYFSAQLSDSPVGFGTWKGTAISEGQSSETATNQSLGVFARFSTLSNQVIYLKVAVSFVSAEQADAYLSREIPAWDFEGLRSRARGAWDNALSAIEIDGVPAGGERIFYTAFYHALTQPRDRTGDNPNWVSRAPYWDDHYTLWDTWRTLFPLLALVDPEAVAGNINSFIDRHEHNGYVATAFIQGKEMTVGQGGDEVDNVIADAYVKGVPGINWTHAYAVQKYNAEKRRTPDYRDQGYVSVGETNGYDHRMKSGSSTLAFAYNDYCVAQVAKGLGRTGDYQMYSRRAANWTNVWDATLQDAAFGGFVRGRKRDGSFTATVANGGYNKDFYEGTCWIYSYCVPHDLPGLIEKMGGTNLFVKRLSHALESNLIDFSNEPSFQTLWWFAAVNRPDLAAYWADQLRSKFTASGYPGDEDSGAMSSLQIFLAAGIFPIAGQDIYYLHGPQFGRMSIRLHNGRTFTIIGKQASPTNIYIQSVTLNGVDLPHPWIRHADIANGGTLEFTMGDTVSTWGTAGLRGAR